MFYCIYKVSFDHICISNQIYNISPPTGCQSYLKYWNTRLILKIYTPLKIKNNSVRIRFLSWQFFCSLLTRLELTQLILFQTNNLAPYVQRPNTFQATSAIYRDFNIFQVYQYFTICRQYFLLKFSLISYTTLFKMRRYQRPF